MKNTKNILAVCLAALGCMTAVAFANHHAEKQTATNTTENQMVTLKTNMGDIKLELDAKKAPNTVENFLQYVEEGHYNDVVFHRVIENFMIQGGGFDVAMQQKKTRASIVNEADNGLTNDKYTVAMARTGEPHSASAQFFINTKNNDFLNHTSPTPSGWGYAVFAKVVEGTDVVDKIEKVATGQAGPYSDVPLESVIIESVEVSE